MDCEIVAVLIKFTEFFIINLREKILAWTRIQTRVSSSTYWCYNH